MQKKIQQGFVSQTTGELGVERARRLFLQWTWLPRVYGMDQGIDLVVEVADAGQGTGHVFAVQCKASRTSSQVKRDGVSVPLEGRVISYLLNQRFPAFLFFCPLDTDFLYWVDVRLALKGASRKRDGSALIKIPLSNRFDVSSAVSQNLMRDIFIGALAASDKEFKAISMSLVATTIKEKEERLEALDPRCAVKIAASSAGEEINIFAKEEFSIRASLKTATSEDARRMKEAIDFGIDATMQMRDVRFSGSPLFDEIAGSVSSGSLSLRAENKVHYLLKVSGQNEAPGKPRQLRLGGMMSKGIRGASLFAGAEDHPVKIDLRAISDERVIQLTMHTGYESMIGLRVTAQSRLNHAADVLYQLASSGVMCVELVSQEIDTEIKNEITQEMAQVLFSGAARLSALSDLKCLCERYSPSFKIARPDATSDKEAEWWNIARRVCDGEQVQIDAKEFTLAGEFSSDLRELVGADGCVADFAVCSYKLRIFAFGDPLCTLPVDVFFRGFKGQVQGSSESQKLLLAAIADSEAVIRLAKPEPSSDCVIFRNVDEIAQ